jgi:hypothetical protein
MLSITYMIIIGYDPYGDLFPHSIPRRTRACPISHDMGGYETCVGRIACAPIIASRTSAACRCGPP